MRVLVTGGAGFIGSHIVRALLDRGAAVAVVDNLSSGKAENLPSGIEFHKVDTRDNDGLNSAFQSFLPTHVIHAAGDSSSRIGRGDAAFSAATNVIGSVNVLNAALESHAEKFIFTSTAGVYGEIEEGTTAKETHPFQPHSPYAASKASFELFLNALTTPCEIQSVVLRLANVYGPRQTSGECGGVVAIFINRLLRGQPVDIYSGAVDGDGGCRRNYIYVGDVVSAVLLALTTDAAGTFNVATSEAHRTAEMLQVVSDVVGVTAKVNSHPPRVSELKASALDSSRIRSLGWSANTTLKEGLEETVAYFRVQLQTQPDMCMS